MNYLTKQIAIMLAEKKLSQKNILYLSKVCQAEEKLTKNFNKKQLDDFFQYDEVRVFYENMLVDEAIEFTIKICKKIFCKN